MGLTNAAQEDALFQDRAQYAKNRYRNVPHFHRIKVDVVLLGVADATIIWRTMQFIVMKTMDGAGPQVITNMLNLVTCMTGNLSRVKVMKIDLNRLYRYKSIY